MDQPAELFDRQLLRRRRARTRDALVEADFLLREAADGIGDRLSTVARSFPLAVDFGAHSGLVGEALRASGKVETVVATESDVPLLMRQGGLRVACDEEFPPFAEGSLDLVASGLSLQWVNDLPGALVQIRRALKPDGLFLAAMLGGQTLRDLRQALLDAEAEITGGAAPRVAPMIEIRDMGALLQRAGFALPVADAETLTVRYGNPINLLRDLRHMGWTNALNARSRRPLRRDVLARALELYAGSASDEDGKVRARFDIVYASGWAPHESQQKPLRPGSARMRLADALGVEERPAGEKTGR
ncbi:methyltransferase domain-containing protein [Lutibaculum baratangense]|uniref:SAM-dependent methyltransferase n=1 Tax=Lutibaculum baratangense AMV1 TaxID=631454 RepID=V4RFD7_9HYPH|nr:methyltransferase domain-containing protein [Lutibaculum baratangense]ESR24089.1 SAM-dependent methyltransferase [Lutibaculum baratangense AMV1]